MSSIVLWVMKYDVFAALPPDLKLLLNINLSDIQIDELSQKYHDNYGYYNWVLTTCNKFDRSGYLKNNKNDVIKLCTFILDKRNTLKDIDDEDKRVFLATIVYLIESIK